MNKTLLLAVILLSFGCANESTQSVTPVAKEAEVKPIPTLRFEDIKLGISRTEAEKILGEPSSITDTPVGTTLVWLVGPGAQVAAPPPADNKGLFSAVGSIVTTTLGIFFPIAGTASSIGTQVYNAASAVNADPAAGAPKNDILTVTIEFRNDQAYSIQRSKPTNVPIPKTP